jgi:hypothetical protein
VRLVALEEQRGRQNFCAAVHAKVLQVWVTRDDDAARCDGSCVAASTLRALATLMPVLAAAASWLCSPLNALYLFTCKSVMRLPGTVIASSRR